MDLDQEKEIESILPYTPLSRPSRWPDPTMNFIVAYDIADPKRLKLVAKLLERDARRVQKSVFMFHGSRKQLDGIISGLVQYIDPFADRIQAWPVRTSTRAGRVDAGNAIPDTGVALIMASDEWTVVEAMDDSHSDELFLLE